MLLPDNIHPENSVYYNGAIVLDVLQKNSSIELLELYRLVKKIRNISFPLFILSLDWLYLIDIVDLKKEKVELCS
jgi:hypothetical protein